MKKWLLLFVCLNFGWCLGVDVINLDKSVNPVAKEILYEYVLKEMNLTPIEAEKDYSIALDVIFADFVDLNDDGVEEVVGFLNSFYHYGIIGENLFILSKTGTDEYKNVVYLVNFYPHKIKVLNTKTNGYKDLEVTVRNLELFGKNDNFVKQFFVRKYIKTPLKYQENGVYYSKYQLKQFKDYLKKFK